MPRAKSSRAPTRPAPAARAQEVSCVHAQRERFLAELAVVAEAVDAADTAFAAVYVGAAPGAHIPVLAGLFPKSHWTLFDPNPLMPIRGGQLKQLTVHERDFALADAAAIAAVGCDFVFVDLAAEAPADCCPAIDLAAAAADAAAAYAARHAACLEFVEALAPRRAAAIRIALAPAFGGLAGESVEVFEGRLVGAPFCRDAVYTIRAAAGRRTASRAELEQVVGEADDNAREEEIWAAYRRLPAASASAGPAALTTALGLPPSSCSGAVNGAVINDWDGSSPAADDARNDTRASAEPQMVAAAQRGLVIASRGGWRPPAATAAALVVSRLPPGLLGPAEARAVCANASTIAPAPPIFYDPAPAAAAGVGYVARPARLADILTLHRGQRKLFVSELLLFAELFPDANAAAVVVYAGAAPGRHLPFLARLYPRIEFHLYDPAPFAPLPREQFRVHQDFFTDETAASWRNRCDVFISDIRLSSETGADGWSPQAEAQIAEDMAAQARWTQTIAPRAGALLKFRPPYLVAGAAVPAFRYLAGDVFWQAWAPRSSTEGRLLARPPYREVEFDIAAYEAGCAHHNTTRRAWATYALPAPGLADVPGFDRCFDCSLEATAFARYCASAGRPASAVAELMNELSAAIAQPLSKVAGSLHGELPAWPTALRLLALRQFPAELARLAATTTRRSARDDHGRRRAAKAGGAGAAGAEQPKPGWLTAGNARDRSWVRYEAALRSASVSCAATADARYAEAAAGRHRHGGIRGGGSDSGSAGRRITGSMAVASLLQAQPCPLPAAARALVAAANRAGALVGVDADHVDAMAADACGFGACAALAETLAPVAPKTAALAAAARQAARATRDLDRLSVDIAEPAAVRALEAEIADVAAEVEKLRGRLAHAYTAAAHRLT